VFGQVSYHRVVYVDKSIEVGSDIVIDFLREVKGFER
jgi:hypothetical protein